MIPTLIRFGRFSVKDQRAQKTAVDAAAFPFDDADQCVAQRIKNITPERETLLLVLQRPLSHLGLLQLHQMRSRAWTA